MTDTVPVDVVVHADTSVPYLDADVRAALAALRGDGRPLDVFRGGSWFATAAVRGEIVGCAGAVRSPDAAPGPVTPALHALGPDRYDEWLAGGLELTEVIVAPGRRRGGIGTALQQAILTPACGRRGWVQLTGHAVESAGWFRCRGWTCVASDRVTGALLLLNPRHPRLRDRAGTRT